MQVHQIENSQRVSQEARGAQPVDGGQDRLYCPVPTEAVNLRCLKMGPKLNYRHVCREASHKGVRPTLQLLIVELVNPTLQLGNGSPSLL